MAMGTFDWNYAALIYEDEDHQYWWDVKNETRHITGKLKGRNH